MMRLLVLLACLGWVGPAFAETLFVDPTTTSCSSPDTDYDPATETCGSGADPNYRVYTTFAAAITASANGDTIYVRAGTYLTRVIFTGQGKSNITFAGYPDDAREDIIIAPNAANNFTTGNPVIRNTATTGITFKHFTLSGANGPTSDPSPAGQIQGWYMDTVTDGRIEDVEITGFHYHGLYVEASTITIKNVVIHDQVSACVAGNRWYGMYLAKGSGYVVEGNQVYSNPGGGIQVYSASGNISTVAIRKNIIRDNNSCTSSSVGGIVVAEESGRTVSGVTISRNLIYSNGSAVSNGPSPGIDIQGGVDGTRIIHNVVYNNHHSSATGALGRGIVLQSYASASPSNTTIQNNIVTGNDAEEILVAAGTNTTNSHNACNTPGESCGSSALDIAAITDCTPSTSDFTQKAGSSCIDQGTTVAGFGSNGSAPDIGAFETIVFSACAVEDGAAGVITVTFTNNVNAPLLPATGVTTFTTRHDGGANVVTGVTRNGDNQLDIALTDDVTGGNTVDISWSSGNLTDSALIGGTLTQPYVTTLSQQSCTNNVSAAASHLFIQASSEWHGLYGTEAAPVMLRTAAGATENLPINVIPGGRARLRISVTCEDADCPPVGFFPFVSVSGGGYAQIADLPFDASNIAFCGTDANPTIPESGTATTDQLSTSGTFVAGALVRTSNAIPTVDLDNDPAQKTELEYCFVWDTDAEAGATYDFRLRKQDGSVIDTYTVTPRATVQNSVGGGMF